MGEDEIDGKCGSWGWYWADKGVRCLKLERVSDKRKVLTSTCMSCEVGLSGSGSDESSSYYFQPSPSYQNWFPSFFFYFLLWPLVGFVRVEVSLRQAFASAQIRYLHPTSSKYWGLRASSSVYQDPPP